MPERQLRPLHSTRPMPRFTGEPTEEPPGDPPVCPGCGAVGEFFSAKLSPDTIGWCWSTTHLADCPWMADPNAEPY